MKTSLFILLFVSAILFACGRDDIKRIVNDDKLQKDSEAVAEDLINIGEDLIKDELGIDKKKE